MKRLRHLSELYRLPDDGIICGVCAGLAAYYGWRVRTVRFLVFLMALLVTWPVVLGYLAACFLLPSLDEEQKAPTAPRARAAQPEAGTTKPPYSGPLRERYEKIESRMRRVEAYLHGHEYQLRTAFRDLERG